MAAGGIEEAFEPGARGIFVTSGDRFGVFPAGSGGGTASSRGEKNGEGRERGKDSASLLEFILLGSAWITLSARHVLLVQSKGYNAYNTESLNFTNDPLTSVLNRTRSLPLDSSHLPLSLRPISSFPSSEVKARAPGKIILSGENAVVHGSTVVAASIDLCTYATLRFPAHSDNDGLLGLELKDIGLEFSWPVVRIKEALSGIDVPNPSTPTSCPAEAIKSLAILVEELNIPEAKIGIAAGVLAFLWLYSSIQGFKPATVIISSELPLGSGLGSSTHQHLWSQTDE
ncbi:mevalonate kinase-like [Rosa rugosa]|uniref:mevalonate kinase-like n=1 Tax=Rosa rugosa TaxID=74645 RepID=UPI002B400E7C|nr:mevalonate kinase-like [Rosa rugosa]